MIIWPICCKEREAIIFAINAKILREITLDQHIIAHLAKWISALFVLTQRQPINDYFISQF